jgi:hypothetical protein
MDSSLTLGMTTVGRVSDCGMEQRFCHCEKQRFCHCEKQRFCHAERSEASTLSMDSSLAIGMTDKACMDCERGDAIHCSGMIAVFSP